MAKKRLNHLPFGTGAKRVAEQAVFPVFNPKRVVWVGRLEPGLPYFFARLRLSAIRFNRATGAFSKVVVPNMFKLACKSLFEMVVLRDFFTTNTVLCSF